MSEPATMIAGWREIGKICGHYEPKKISVDLSINGQLVLDRMDKLSDRELIDIIQKARTEGIDQSDLLPLLPDTEPSP
jgi:hypothetical protein